MRTSQLVSVLLAAGISGCAGTSAQPNLALSVPRAGASRSAAVPPGGTGSEHAWLYVSGGNNVVEAYDLQRKGNPQVFTLSNGINQPQGLFVDGTGKLYVANRGTGSVNEYPFGETSPSATLNVSEPASMTVNPNDNELYVVTRSNPATVQIFLPHESSPAKTLTSKLLVAPEQIVADAAGDMYIADNQNGVLYIGAGKYSIASLGLQDLYGCSSGLALDTTNSQLFVSSCDGGVQVYPLGSTFPSRTLSNTYRAEFLAIGSVGKYVELFDPYDASDTVGVYRDNSNTRFASLLTGANPATGVAVKPENVP